MKLWSANRKKQASLSLGEQILRSDRASPYWVLWFCAWTLAIIFMLGSRADAPQEMIHQLFTLGLVLTLFGFSAALGRQYVRKRDLVHVSELINDVSEVPDLIRAMEEGSDRVRKIARAPLLKLLPLLREEHAEELRHNHYEWFHHVLRVSSYSNLFDRSLTEAVLEAQRYIAMPTIVPIVKQISENGPRPFRSKALEILPEVCARASRVQNSKTLLRPSDQPVDPSALLRPAGAGETDESQLLRPI